jgi:hypothetical protein
MTVLDASGLLFEWFRNNDSFEMSKDFIGLIMVSDTPEQDEAAILLALDKLKESHVLEAVSVGEVKYWVLSKSFEAYEQTVSVSPVLATSIARVVNDYCEFLDDPSEKVDPTNIQEKDLQNMLFVCTKFLEEKS